MYVCTKSDSLASGLTRWRRNWRVGYNSTTFIHALSLSRTHSCVVFASHSFMCRFCVALIHASFLRCTHSRVALIHALHLFIYRTHWCITLFMRRTHLCIAFIHSSHSFNDTLHLLMRCTHSCIASSMRYVASLFSRISHAACSLFTPFSSLTCIKSQTSWQECSATIKMSMRADVHKIHCWPTQLLFSLVLDSLNLHSCQPIFHNQPATATGDLFRSRIAYPQGRPGCLMKTSSSL